MRPNRKLSTAGVLLLAALFVFAVVQAGDALVQPGPDAVRHRKKIENMSQLERDRLTHNFKDFKEKQKAAERKRFRDLHAALQDGAHGAALAQVMDDYYGWFKNLAPDQKLKLRDETDPVAKADLVAKFLDAQPPEGPLPGEVRSRRPQLSSSEAAKVMNILEQSIQDPSMQAQLGGLGDLEGIWRYTKLMEIIHGTGENRRKTNEPLRHILTDDVSQRIVGAIDDETRRRRLKESDGERLRFRLVGMIHRILYNEYWKIMPSEAKRLEFFGTELEFEEQQQIIVLPLAEAKRALLMKFLEHHSGEYPKRPGKVLPSWRPGGSRMRHGGGRGSRDRGRRSPKRAREEA